MFQKLEPRQLLAVTVIETYPSYYEIHGTQGNDSISVTVSQQYETMTVNGDTYYGVGYIAIAAYEGEDVIRVVTVDGPGYIAAGISGATCAVSVMSIVKVLRSR